MNCQLKGVHLLESKIPSLGQSPGGKPAGQLGFFPHLLEKQLRVHLWGPLRTSNDVIMYGDSVLTFLLWLYFCSFTQQDTEPGSLWNWNSPWHSRRPKQLPKLSNTSRSCHGYYEISPMGSPVMTQTLCDGGEIVGRTAWGTSWHGELTQET